VPDASEPGAVPRALVENEVRTQWLHPGFKLELFRDEAEGYYLNLSSQKPFVFVNWLEEEGAGVPKAVTVSYNEAARLMDAGARVDGVPMPPQWIPWLAEYVERNYKPEPKKRSRPPSFKGQSAMIADDKENFASRWSRRKIEARKTAEKPAETQPPAERAPAAAAVANTGAAAAPTDASAPRELPPLESLKGLASEYTEFLKPGVGENLRRSALKKLFSDPHFENFERFEAYCEDFTQGEPIPLAMLKTLEHAKGLLFDDEEKKDPHAAAETPAVQSLPEAAEKAQSEAQAETPPPEPAERKDKA